jgi:hypothetical protein
MRADTKDIHSPDGQFLGASRVRAGVLSQSEPGFNSSAHTSSVVLASLVEVCRMCYLLEEWRLLGRYAVWLL